MSLSQKILGPNTILQGAMSDIFTNTPQSFYSDGVATMQVIYACLVCCSPLTKFHFKLVNVCIFLALCSATQRFATKPFEMCQA